MTLEVQKKREYQIPVILTLPKNLQAHKLHVIVIALERKTMLVGRSQTQDNCTAGTIYYTYITRIFTLKLSVHLASCLIAC